MKDKLREKGDRLLQDGTALGDTSGRTRELNEKSVFGLSTKSFGFSILVTSSEKKKIYHKLVKKHGDERTLALIHSVKIYYAIKGYIDTCPSFYICCDGFNPGLLKQYLRNLMGNNYHDKKINFVSSLKPYFGKQNIADRLAYEVNKNGKNRR